VQKQVVDGSTNSNEYVIVNEHTHAHLYEHTYDKSVMINIIIHHIIVIVNRRRLPTSWVMTCAESAQSFATVISFAGGVGVRVSKTINNNRDRAMWRWKISPTNAWISMCVWISGRHGGDSSALRTRTGHREVEIIYN